MTGEVISGFGLAIAVVVSLSIKVADQWERVVILRLGKFHSLKGPGLFFLIPVLDQIPYPQGNGQGSNGQPKEHELLR